MEKLFFLVGADDPEMREIIRVLTDNGYDFDYAYAKSGRRATPGEAYYCNTPVVPAGHTLVCIECQPEGYKDGDYIKIDHHRPGDPGFALTAEHYFEASSIGQLCELIFIEPTDELRVVAAMDHCFAHALRGECPKVRISDVLDAYVTTIAEGRDTDVSAVGKQILERAEQMSRENEIMIGTKCVHDCREWELGMGYSVEYLATIAAAAISGSAILLSSTDMAGRKKIALCGYVQPDTVDAFIANASNQFNLKGIYGVPNRGYAGGYLS